MMDQEDKLSGRIHGEQPEVSKSALGARLVYVVILWLMVQFALTVLGVVTVIQFILMLVSGGQANERLAEFGTDLGVWMAKAARFLTGASEVKPWPWTELD